MDATNDVIIGSASNYNWWDFQNYAISLSRSGFRGRKVLFVHNISRVARETLVTLGFEIIDFTPTMNQIVVERFKILHNWLAKQEGLRYVIHCDVRDVVFQTDTSLWMEKQSAKIFGTSEFIVYKDEACNPFWVEQLYGCTGLDTLRHEDVICAGTLCGEAETIKKLSLRIFESSTDRHGDDQAALNILLRTEFKDEMIIPEPADAFVLTAGWWLIGFQPDNADCPVGKRSRLQKMPPELKDGIAYPQASSIPFCIVHQYERGNRWIPAIAKKYTPDFEVNEEEKTRYLSSPHIFQEGVPNNKPPKYASDGCTIDWWDTHTRV